MSTVRNNFVVIIALILSIITAGYRISFESSNKNIQVAIKYEDVLTILENTPTPIEQIFEELKTAGVTTITVNEDNLEDCENVGFYPNFQNVYDANLFGFNISPTITNFDSTIINQLTQLENLTYTTFDSIYIPIEKEGVVEFVEQYGLGYTEFYSNTQINFDELANQTKINNQYNMVRIYSDEKVPYISTPDVLPRYELALTERGNKFFVFLLEDKVQLQNANKSGETYIRDTNQEYTNLKQNISDFIEIANSKGYSTTQNNLVYNYSSSPIPVLYIIGLFPIYLVILILYLLGLFKIANFSGILLLIGYGVGLFVSKQLALQAMALLTAIVFPIYGTTLYIKEETPTIKSTIIQFLKISAITFAGGIILTGLLSHDNYALGIDGFRGVKVAQIIPLIFVSCFIIKVDWQHLKEELKKYLELNKVTKIAIFLVASVTIILVLIIYIIRTGNSSISVMEQQFRQALDQILGVRPRTKEFLIGHPAMIVGLYFSHRWIRWPAILAGLIGQMSIINTYAHIHTPLTISVTRSMYGILFGILIGSILIHMLKFMFKVINKWIIK